MNLAHGCGGHRAVRNHRQRIKPDSRHNQLKASRYRKHIVNKYSEQADTTNRKPADTENTHRQQIQPASRHTSGESADTTSGHSQQIQPAQRGQHTASTRSQQTQPANTVKTHSQQTAFIYSQHTQPADTANTHLFCLPRRSCQHSRAVERKKPEGETKGYAATKSPPNEMCPMVFSHFFPR